MPNAILIPPVGGTQASSFDVLVEFTEGEVSGFAKTNVEISDDALLDSDNNPITGTGRNITDFDLYPDPDMDSRNEDYRLHFSVPSDVSGNLTVRLTGSVTPDGSSQAEAISANAITVQYDTNTAVSATFGTVAYQDGGVVVVPVTFGSDVVAPSKTVFSVSHVSGDELAGIEYYIVGEDAAYELIFQIPADRSGRFSVGADGAVLKETGIWVPVTVASALTVPYSTIAPEIVDFDIPASYVAGQKFDVRVAWNVLVTGWHANNTFTKPHGIFLPEGANLGSALPYKWVGTSPPDFTVPVPDDLTGTDWRLLATPPGGHEGEWHGEEAQYFMIRFPSVEANATGIFSMTLREGNPIRGPID